MQSIRGIVTVSLTKECTVYNWCPIGAESNVPLQNQFGYQANILIFSSVPRISISISGLLEIKNSWPLVVYNGSSTSTSSCFLFRRTILDELSFEGSFNAAAIEIELVEFWITEEVTSSVRVERNLIASTVLTASIDAKSV